MKKNLCDKEIILTEEDVERIKEIEKNIFQPSSSTATTPNILLLNVKELNMQEILS